MSGKLSVHCIAGRNLYDAGDLIGSQDPYLKLTLGSTKLKSSVHRNGGKQAQWADKLTFPVPADPALAPTTLHVACWDKDTISSDDLIGTAEVNLPQVLAATGVFDGWIDLSRDGGKQAAGQVYLVIRYEGDQAGGVFAAAAEGGSSVHSIAVAAAAVVGGGAVAAVVAQKLDEKERKKDKKRRKQKKHKKNQKQNEDPNNENGEGDNKGGVEEGGSASDSSSDDECEGGDVGGDEESGGVGKMIGDIFEAIFGDD